MRHATGSFLHKDLFCERKRIIENAKQAEALHSASFYVSPTDVGPIKLRSTFLGNHGGLTLPQSIHANSRHLRCLIS